MDKRSLGLLLYVTFIGGLVWYAENSDPIGSGTLILAVIMGFLVGTVGGSFTLQESGASHLLVSVLSGLRDRRIVKGGK